MRKCILVLSVSLFFTAVFIVYRATVTDTHPLAAQSPEIMQIAKAVAKHPLPEAQEISSEISTAAAQDFADTDTVFQQVAALAQPAPTSPPSIPEHQAAQRASGPAQTILQELTEAAEKRSEYAARLGDISTQLEAAKAERTALRTQQANLEESRTTLDAKKEELRSLQQDRDALRQSLAALDSEIAEKETVAEGAQSALSRVKAAGDRLAVLKKQIAASEKAMHANTSRMASLDDKIAAHGASIAQLVEAIAALEKTHEDSKRIEKSLEAVGDAATADMVALRQGITTTRKAAAATLKQKHTDKEAAENAHKAAIAERNKLEPDMVQMVSELNALRQEQSQLESIQLQTPNAGETLEETANAIKQAKRQRAQVADRLQAIEEKTRTVEGPLEHLENVAGELADLEAAIAEVSVEIERLSKDQDTYQSQLSPIDEKIVTLQEQMRHALALSDAALTGGTLQYHSSHPEEAAGRSLVTSLGDGAFAPGDSVLQEIVHEQIASAVAQVSSASGVRISVEGHTDDSPLGSYVKERYLDNIGLSFHRAKAVADALIARGIDASIVSVAAHGAGKPTSPNSSSSGRAKNRRVEIWLVPNNG